MAEASRSISQLEIAQGGPEELEAGDTVHARDGDGRSRAKTVPQYVEPGDLGSAAFESASSFGQRAANLSDLANVLTARGNLKIVVLTMSAYDSLDPRDPDTIYFCTE